MVRPHIIALALTASMVVAVMSGCAHEPLGLSERQAQRWRNDWAGETYSTDEQSSAADKANLLPALLEVFTLWLNFENQRDAAKALLDTAGQ